MNSQELFTLLEDIHSRPKPFEFYTAAELWTDEHTSQQMLTYHLNEAIDVSSRNAAFIEKSVAWISDKFNVGEGVKIADFGCGPGLYSTRLARTKASVTGIDFSQRSIEYARKTAADENLNGNFIQQNYLDFDTEERFDLVMMIMCDFCALSPDQRVTMLKKFHKLLKPGGSVLLDVYSLKAFEQRDEAFSVELNQLNSFWSPNRYYGFVNTFKYDEEKVTLDKYTIVEADRIRNVYNWLQHFSPEELQREFTEAGFDVEKLYGDVAGSDFTPDSNEFAIVATRS